MERLFNRLIQGRTGTLGVIQTQAVHLHELAFQGFIQRLMQRLLIPERFVARYGGLKQRHEIALRFNLNRVEAIAPGESPETLWLSLQARFSRLTGASSQEEICSSEQEHILPQWLDPSPKSGRSIPSRNIEEDSSDSIGEVHSRSTVSRKSEQLSPPGSTILNPDKHPESDTFRVRRVSPQFADTAEMLFPLQSHAGIKEAIASSHSTPSHQNAIPENPSAVISTVKPITESTVKAGFANEFTSPSNRDTSDLPLRNALTDTDISHNPVRIQPKRSLSNLPTELDSSLKVSLKSTQPLYAAPQPPNTGGLKTTQSPPVLGDLGGECNASVLLKQPPRVPANLTNNPLLQSFPRQENSEMIATPSLPLAKSFAQPSPAAQIPLPLAMPKRQQDFESRDRPREIETSADWQHTTHPVPGEQPISPVSQSMSPINVQNITEQVSRQIFRQLRLERERRGIHP
jgi:hypothetical protein